MESLDVLKSVVSPLLAGNRHAVKYLAPGLVVKATRRHKPDGRASRVEIIVTIGKPNFLERQFIKAAKVADEPFPVRRVQVTPWKA